MTSRLLFFNYFFHYCLLFNSWNLFFCFPDIVLGLFPFHQQPPLIQRTKDSGLSWFQPVRLYLRALKAAFLQVSQLVCLCTQPTLGQTEKCYTRRRATESARAKKGLATGLGISYQLRPVQKNGKGQNIETLLAMQLEKRKKVKLH